MRLSIQDQYQLPPSSYLEQVLEHCSKSGFLYLQLWKKKDKDHKLTIDLTTVKKEFLVSRHKFNHDIFLLVKEGLVSVIKEETDSIILEMVAWDQDYDGFIPC